MKSDRIKNWPKEERPRDRLPAEGAEKLTEEGSKRGSGFIPVSVRVSLGSDHFSYSPNLQTYRVKVLLAPVLLGRTKGSCCVCAERALGWGCFRP